MAAQSDFQSTTQKFLDIYDITNNLVILKNGTVSFILRVSAMNFGLLAEAEQDAVIYTYAAMLNSLNYPVQIIVKSQTKDATDYLNLLKKQQEKASSDNKRERIARYRHFVANLIKQRNVLDKKFFVIAPAKPVELGLMTADSVLPGRTDFDISKYEKSVILEKAEIVLEPKRDHLISQFGRIGLFARQLSTQEIIREFYTSYNPEASEGQEIADSNQYTTPMVRANLIQQTQQILNQSQQQAAAQTVNNFSVNDSLNNQATQENQQKSRVQDQNVQISQQQAAQQQLGQQQRTAQQQVIQQQQSIQKNTNQQLAAQEDSRSQQPTNQQQTSNQQQGSDQQQNIQQQTSQSVAQATKSTDQATQSTAQATQPAPQPNQNRPNANMPSSNSANTRLTFNQGPSLTAEKKPENLKTKAQQKNELEQPENRQQQLPENKQRLQQLTSQQTPNDQVGNDNIPNPSHQSQSGIQENIGDFSADVNTSQPNKGSNNNQKKSKSNQQQSKSNQQQKVQPTDGVQVKQHTKTDPNESLGAQPTMSLAQQATNSSINKPNNQQHENQASLKGKSQKQTPQAKIEPVKKPEEKSEQDLDKLDKTEVQNELNTNLNKKEENKERGDNQDHPRKDQGNSRNNQGHPKNNQGNSRNSQANQQKKQDSQPQDQIQQKINDTLKEVSVFTEEDQQPQPNKSNKNKQGQEQNGDLPPIAEIT